MKIKMADAEYFALERLSFSSLKHILDSPNKYLHEKLFPFRGNDATELGTAIHMWLQGEKDKVVFEPSLQGIKTKEGALAKNPRMTNEGKAILEEFRKSTPAGVIIVPFETKELLGKIEDQFKANPDISILMRTIKDIEGAYLTKIEGLDFKGKLDFEGDKYIVDLKSTGKSASEKSFKFTITDSHYDLQAAVYLTMKAQAVGCRVDELEYYIIAVETFAPYEVVPYKLSNELIAQGLQKLSLACQLYKEYVQNPSGAPTKKFTHRLKVI